MSDPIRAGSPVRLQGADAEVVLIAQRARRAIDADRRLARELVPGLSSLRRARQEAMAPKPLSPTPPAPGEQRGNTASGILWSVVIGLGLLSMLTFAWVLAPPVRGFSVATDIAQPVLVVSGVLALVLLALASATASFARPAQVGMAAVWAGIVAAISAFVFVYRLVVGSSLGTALPPEQMVMWFSWMVLLLSLTIFSALRWRRRVRAAEESRGVSWGGDPDRRLDAKRVLSVAHELASRRSVAPGVVSEWDRALDSLQDIDAGAIAQARALGPAAWLVWTVYDGDFDVRGLRIG